MKSPVEPEKKPRTRTKSSIASSKFERVLALRRECEEAIAASPAAIRERYAAKEAKVLAELDAETRGFVEALLSRHTAPVE